MRCPICYHESLGSIDRPCCAECNDVLSWFRMRLGRNTEAEGKAVTVHCSFSRDLAIDSLDLVEIMIDLENDFDVSISGVDALAIDTVGDAISYVRRIRSAVPPLQTANIMAHSGSINAPGGLRGRFSSLFTKIRRPR